MSLLLLHKDEDDLVKKQEIYLAIQDMIHELGLDTIWDVKALVNGSDIIKALSHENRGRPIIRLEDLEDQAADLRELTRDENLRETGTEDTVNGDVPSDSESESPIPTPRPSEVLKTPSLASVGLHCSNEELPRNGVIHEMSCYGASNILWSTGSFSEPIPNGFYSVILDDRLNHFKSIPTLEELRALGDEGLKADVIVVDLDKDNKIKWLKKLAIVLERSNPAKAVKIIGDLVVDFYKLAASRSTSKTRQSLGSYGFPLLGQISNGSCHARAILFKVLADAVNLKSKLVKGCPSDLNSSATVDSHNHMSVVVMINSVETLAPISVAGKCSCHSPLKPQSQIERGRSVGDVNESLIQTLFSKEQGDNDSTESNDIHIWKEVLASPMFQNKPLLPNEECIIDFSTLILRKTRVGFGCSAEVFRGTWNETEVAVKIFKDQAVTVENIKDFCNEIFILSRIQHPNVIMFHGACVKPRQLALVTEYVEKGSLYHLLHKTDVIKNLSWRKKINILHDICRGLMCIHGMGIPWEGVPQAKVLNIVAKGARLDIPEGPLAKLIEACWSEVPEQRPRCEEILTYLATCEKSLP
ncbi:BnaA04g24620D [Brassica napus]|uniref:BnaA04g24620D protein n=1 Tax=Brassica napus TaxID=3708 RepID=A0A078IF47_BRANA|nr:BnaA04g24620D [Brassica napus]